ncbi:MAG TPA: 50S ribosomal protein L24 [Dehalococcoidia bacterium]|nr:50S ribosomal protein L24 [Dehalococcoidia bacterium]
MKIRKDDQVLVISGKDKGKKGKVRYAFPKEERVIVEGVNMIKKHTKARAMARQAGIIEREAPLYVSKVMLICSKCNRPTRVGLRFLEEGRKVRVCSSCHEVID